jgi:hypothetical protein
MRRGLIALAVIAAALVPVIGSPEPAAAAPIKECGDLPVQGFYVVNITTRVTPCSKARRMAWTWYRQRAPQPPDGAGTPYRWGSWSCRYRTLGHESGDLRCTASRGRVVHWQDGA